MTFGSGFTTKRCLTHGLTAIYKTVSVIETTYSFIYTNLYEKVISKVKLLIGKGIKCLLISSQSHDSLCPTNLTVSRITFQRRISAVTLNRTESKILHHTPTMFGEAIKRIEDQSKYSQ